MDQPGSFTSHPCATMETELLLAPVTALEVVGDHLVAGEGPNIVLYPLESEASQSVRCSRQVLRNSNVHGIKEQQNVTRREAGSCTLAVFGGKSLVGIELSFRDSQVNLAESFPLCELHDWIWDLQWLEGSPESLHSVALALGHNSVALFDCRGQTVLREVHCQEKCILYSAHLVGSSWEALVLLAGTVFNQLVVWHVADPKDATGRVRPRSRIRGHNGVIFSICYSESKGLLASASDDRSLRLWDVGDLRTASGSASCLLVCYGHQARVWSVKLLSDSIISIGEDSACLVWNYQGDIIRSFRSHKGRGLRAVAVHEGRGWVFAGGADSGIRQWSLKGPRARGNSLLRLNFPSPQRKGSPRSVKLVGATRLLVVTDAGAVYTYDLTSKTWELVLEDVAYRSYSLLEARTLGRGFTVCAMGNLLGHVKVFPLNSPLHSQELQLFTGKVHSLSWASRWPEKNPNTCSLLVSGSAGALLWLEVSFHPDRGLAVELKQGFLLPLCKQRWHTCAAFLPQGGLLLCGDRRGSVMLFACQPALPVDKPSRRGESGGSDLEGTCNSSGLAFPVGVEALSAEGPVSLLFGLHGKLGVTSIICHGDFIYTTGRDGCYRQLQVEGEQLRALQKQKPGKGLEWLEELRFGPDGSMQLLGFHGTHFVVWSAESHETLLFIPCGGGHRSWSYTRCHSVELFACVKTGDVLVYQSRDGPREKPVLKEPLHSQELTCVCCLGTLRRPGLEPVRVLATGSEDSAVHIVAFRDGAHSVAPLATIGDHISSVRALAATEVGATPTEKGSLSALLFSAGGRAQIECYRLLLSLSHSPGNGVVCRLAHVASHRLDEHWERMKNRHKYVKMDPETRYMSIVVLSGTEDAESPEPLRFLAAACSDGSIRLFLLLENSQTLSLVAESFHHQRCVLKVQAFAYKAAGGQRRGHIVASAATDGSIAFWDVSATLDLVAQAVKAEVGERKILDLGTQLLTLQAHSCGVNSLQVLKMAGGRFLVASGSDDGSISVSVIEVNDESVLDREAPAKIGICTLRTFSRLCAHAAHVTGVRLLCPDLLLSASVDQRLTLWHLCEESLSFVCSKFCHVADVATLECWEGEGSRYHSVAPPSPEDEEDSQEESIMLRQRHVPGEAQPVAPLEATGTLPSLAVSEARSSALPAASVTTYPGCAMRMSVDQAFGKCHSRARNKEEASRTKCAGWLDKVGAAKKHQTKTAPNTSSGARPSRMVLPQISQGGDKDFEKPGRKQPCLPACSSHAKAGPLGNHDMTPWTGPSQSETSFYALFKPVVSFLHGVPFSAAGTAGSCSFFLDLGENAPAAAAEGEQRRRAARLHANAKPKARPRGLPRHLRSKWHEVKLPPLPSITNLNFSRNFTFSFFELPPHQSHQYGVQRQQLISLLMKQLK